MSTSATLLKETRRNAGVTQSELAGRVGVSQAAIAKLEHPDANPTIATLSDTLRAVGRRLVLTTEPLSAGIDATLVFEQLRLTPEQRLAQLARMYEWGRELAIAGARSRGELA
jgi:transcriptional regulator with XRE-family HTH domain